ncbi:PREDICTED: uncharacterized protein LOC108382046 [Rhagoletis zephyria]|uniref:uncharacterized protein LOC108382046 n=1 Tax=Rhagoletis zephyria TaxID=28612 RepID=UPI0008119A25|nr:PREDICTED: uncharacterized protein LOC108382046 [Rhagoletis zephyria]
MITTNKKNSKTTTATIATTTSTTTPAPPAAAGTIAPAVTTARAITRTPETPSSNTLEGSKSVRRKSSFLDQLTAEEASLFIENARDDEHPGTSEEASCSRTQGKKPTLEQQQKWAHLKLADPNSHSPSQIDLVIGSDFIPQIILEGIEKLSKNLLAQNTIFGWILSGQIPEKVSCFSTQVEQISNERLDSQLRRFRELEEVPKPKIANPEHEMCENLFKSTTTRAPDGRYVVRLPFKPSFLEKIALGQSRTSDLQQFLSMERSLLKKTDLKPLYDNVLEEYATLSHMEVTTPYESASGEKFWAFYLLHHAVVKPEKKTAKLRVVFNASKKSGSGYSLNDVLCTGPTLQPDLMLLILKWRTYKFVFNSDVEKMYRQILLHEGDQDYQQIVFRSETNSPIHDYKLKTVTFGVNCAPYITIRTLHQLAWVPGHRDIPGNCAADELARKGTQLSTISTARNAGTPLSSCKLWLQNNFIERANAKCLQSPRAG